jgi:hypothetical protein
VPPLAGSADGGGGGCADADADAEADAGDDTAARDLASICSDGLRGIDGRRSGLAAFGGGDIDGERIGGLAKGSILFGFLIVPSWSAF